MQKKQNTVDSIRTKSHRKTRADVGPRIRNRDYYAEGRHIANTWEKQAKKLLEFNDDKAICAGMAARIFYEIGTEFLPMLRFDRPVKLDSQWEKEVGLEQLYSKGYHLPNKLRTLFGDAAYGANLVDLIRDDAFICLDNKMSRFSGMDNMATIIPPRPSTVMLLTMLSIPREWNAYLRKLTQGFAALAEWVSKRPTTVERMCRLLVHGYLLSSSLLECIVLFEYAAWRSKQITKETPVRKSGRRHIQVHTKSRRK
jgi:hypothetical protein